MAYGGETLVVEVLEQHQVERRPVVFDKVDHRRLVEAHLADVRPEPPQMYRRRDQVHEFGHFKHVEIWNFDIEINVFNNGVVQMFRLPRK